MGTAGVARAASALALLVVVCTPIRAQGAEFQLQPGISIADFVSVPEGTNSASAFSLRIVTRFPTSMRWLTPIVGAVFLPYGSPQSTTRDTDAPTLFVGNTFRLISPAQTSGWLSFELPLLVTHSPGAGPTGNLRDYGRDLVMQPTIYLHIGPRGLSELGKAWSRLDVFAQLAQNLTPNPDRLTGDRDRLNPVASFGVSFSLGSPPPEE